MTFCFWSCEELEIWAKMKIINFVTRSTSSSWLFDLPDQSGAARVYSYNFLCSISLETAINDIFSWARITHALSIFIKRLEKQTVHWGFTQIVWYITSVNWNLCFYVHLADLSSVRHKTSTWNEIKELIKSNYVIVPSLLNKKSENYDMEWSVGDEAIFRRTTNCTVERKWNEQP